MLGAVDTGAAQPGAGEIDVFFGADGADTFVFGESGTAYYDDGDSGTDGTGDYGYIWDFQSGTDHIRLARGAGEYALTENETGLPAGTAIWLLDNGNGEDELIGIVGGTTGLSLLGGDFLYDPMA